MALETTRFDIQNYIKSHEDQTGYLDAVLEDGDPALIAAAIGDIARARGASQFAKDSGLSRETIYKVFRPGGKSDARYDRQSGESAWPAAVAGTGIQLHQRPDLTGWMIRRPM
ncbi:addiction module antidote protein (plasmid) [Rhizobium gallicum]|nr:addiction module antidote protein [Rhizobium gallicum]